MNAPLEARSTTGLVLAVDGGGTATRAVVVTPAGRCVGYGAAGSGNVTASGLDVAATSIVTASRQAAERAGVDVASLAVAVGALAGADQFDDRLRRAVASAGGPTNFEVAADLLAMYLSGTTVGDGAVLLAGTGAIGGRVVDHALVHVVDGLGWLLGDEGSAFSIGRAVVRAVGATLDGRRPPTALVDLVLDRLAGVAVLGNLYRAPDLRRLLAAVYAENPVSLARFAPLAFAAAADGDAAGRTIVDEATAALTNTLRAVLVDDKALVGPLVFGGGVLAANPSLGDDIAAQVAADGHRLDVIRVSDGVVGAAQLALRAAGHPVDATVLATITATLAPLRE